jgi:hypothetical protein
LTESNAAPSTPEAEVLPVVVPAAPEKVAVIVTRATTLHDQVAALAIVDDAGLIDASDLLASVRAFRKEVDTDLGEPARAARKLWEMIRERFTKHDNPLKADETAIKDAVKAHHQKVARDRQAAIDAAEAQAAARQTEEAARGREFDALVDAGDEEGAAAVLEEAPTPAPARPVSAPKTDGLTVRENWKAEVTSIEKLIQAAASGVDSVALSILSGPKVVAAATTAASQIAKGMKANLKVPGVRSYDDPIVGARKK